jgi:hypothetical protein
MLCNPVGQHFVGRVQTDRSGISILAHYCGWKTAREQCVNATCNFYGVGPFWHMKVQLISVEKVMTTNIVDIEIP